MNKHTKIVIIILIIFSLLIAAYKFLSPIILKKKAYETSDAKDIKGTIKIALDSWIGYFPLRSPVFKKLMRDSKYLVEIIDDEANYPQRMSNLKNGKIDMAVATIDSYLLNGVSEDFPGTIIAIIDESKGGDAIVAWESKINSIEKLKTNTDYKIAFTPGSPSEHLLKSIGVHFDIPELLDKKGEWRIETNGAKDAYKKLLAKKADVAVIWEPHVTEAVSKEGIIKILGTEDTEKLIVDIMLVNRNYSAKNPDVLNLFLSNYFMTLKIYNEDNDKLIADIMENTKSSLENTKAMLKGVEWINLFNNSKWFGFNSEKSFGEEGLVDAIESTTSILIENGDFSQNPLPGNNPNSIINSKFIENIYQSGLVDAASTDTDEVNSLQKDFTKIPDAEWAKLKEIGTLKIRPITFMSGTSNLDSLGNIQVDVIVENLEHYPNFRILIKGHTDTRGDEKANQLLSEERAKAVYEYIISTYNVDPDRVRSIGVGGKEPLKRINGESSRAYNDRLKRVEIHLVTEEY